MDKTERMLVGRYGGFVYGMYLVYKKNRSRIALTVTAVQSFFEDAGYGTVSKTRAMLFIRLVRKYDWNPIVVPRVPRKRGRPRKDEPPRPKKAKRPRRPRQLSLPLLSEPAALPRVAKNLTVRENIENCQKATEWLDFVAQLTYSTVPYVRAKLNEFRIHLGAYALDDPRPAREFKKHFVNWLKQERRRPSMPRCVPASLISIVDQRRQQLNNANQNKPRIMISRDNDMHLAYTALKRAWVSGPAYRDTSQAYYAMMRLGLFEVNGYTHEHMKRDSVRMIAHRAYSELDVNSEYIKIFIRHIQMQGKTVEDAMTALMYHTVRLNGWDRRSPGAVVA